MAITLDMLRDSSNDSVRPLLTDDEGSPGKHADVQELDAPVADPLDAGAAHQDVELPQGARNGPVAGLLLHAQGAPAAEDQPQAGTWPISFDFQCVYAI